MGNVAPIVKVNNFLGLEIFVKSYHGANALELKTVPGDTPANKVFGSYFGAKNFSMSIFGCQKLPWRKRLRTQNDARGHSR